MKLNNLQKNFYIFLSVIISILIATLLWEKINLPLSNITGAKGSLTSKGYNPANDTVRFIFFISLPLIVYLLSNQALNKKTIRIKDLIFEKEEKNNNYHPALLILSVIFIFFIFLEFFSVNYSFSMYIDHTHDSVRLVPAQNYLSTKNFWTSAFLVHGGSDVFYPLLMWKILKVETIGAMRTYTIFLILFVKLLSVLLSYQFTKISNLSKETKILFFTILTSVLISMSNYTFMGVSYYISYKDIYIILFLIIFIELFSHSKLKSLYTILTCLIATIALLFQIDNGAYIFFVLAFYCIYLFIAKKYNEIILIFFSLAICWIVVINLIGFDEFKAFLENTKTIILSIDIMHGLKYPEPFFSIGENPDGPRATRGLLLQLTAGLFVLNCLISNKDKIFNSKKILFAFLFLLSLVMYTKALGRSDAAHLRGSHDLPILINIFFILNYILIFCEKNIFLKRFFSYKNLFSLSIFFLILYYGFNHNHYNINNIKNYKKNFTNFINFKDEAFLHPSEIKLINYYKKFSDEDDCITNITFQMETISYLLKKPTCTKYWSAWLASSIESQKNYINEIKKAQPKYILYEPGDKEGGKLEGIKLSDRIELIVSFILLNYNKYDEFDSYIILKKINN